MRPGAIVDLEVQHIIPDEREKNGAAVDADATEHAARVDFGKRPRKLLEDEGAISGTDRHA
jgi:hypothetical protein